VPLQYSKGSLVDLYSIELRKSYYGAENSKLLLDIVSAIREHDWTANDLMEAIENALANADIANLEWQVREGHSMSDAEQGLRARAIRHINERRVAAKGGIDHRRIQFVPAYGPDVPIEKLTLGVQSSSLHLTGTCDIWGCNEPVRYESVIPDMVTGKNRRLCSSHFRPDAEPVSGDQGHCVR